ncbi:unnamed protein product [Parascedosporium putredinis]|uniref:Uncharacterized protein n=1 Tax=Parascedosporium putredinis TaxID=1442378 RepID=A0A9P1HCY0_9PEZI|nr:unnamed protein product [Parascedosporium putredinis]CAI8004890.1 unnamed protein product [Parascedosporium putredinis]
MIEPFSSSPPHHGPGPASRPSVAARLCNTTVVPRYLFRVHSDTTAGSTTLDAVLAPACLHPNKQRGSGDLFDMDRKEAAGLLNKHLCMVYISIAAADPQAPSPTSTSWYLIPARTPGTFLKDMDLIEYFHLDDESGERDLSRMRRMRRGRGGYYFGEYISQGALDIRATCTQTTIQAMIDVGLFKFFPELGDRLRWKKWADGVDVRRAIVIASACFGDEFAMPIAAMLLALKRPRPDDPAILQGFEAMFTNPDRLPEVRRFGDIIREISESAARELDREELIVEEVETFSLACLSRAVLAASLGLSLLYAVDSLSAPSYYRMATKAGSTTLLSLYSLLRAFCWRTCSTSPLHRQGPRLRRPAVGAVEARASAMLAALSSIMVKFLVPRVEVDLRLPILVYSTTIAAMVISSLTMINGRVIAGAVSFTISDSILATEKFLLSGLAA